MNILKDLQAEFGLTYLFIAHNLSVVEHISDRVGVMYLGKMVELTDRESLFRDPLHPYTKALLSAIPIPDPNYKRERIILTGRYSLAREPAQGLPLPPALPGCGGEVQACGPGVQGAHPRALCGLPCGGRGSRQTRISDYSAIRKCGWRIHSSSDAGVMI